MHWPSKILFTGCLDQFFDYQCRSSGRYGASRFDTRQLDMEDFQGNAVVNYTERNVPYTPSHRAQTF